MQHGGVIFGKSLISVRTFKCDAFVNLQLGTHLCNSCSLLGYLLIELYHLFLQIIETLFLLLVSALQFIQLALVEVYGISSVLELTSVLSLNKLHRKLDELQTTHCPQHRHYGGDYDSE